MATSGSTRTTLISPFQYFADPTRARPIFNGFIFIGRVNGDPTNTADQIPVQVICECGGSPVNVTQPIRTGPGGLPIYNGSPAQIVVCRSNYSITLQDNNRVQVYHSPNVQSGFVNQPITHTTLAAAMADDNSSRQIIRLLERGGAEFRRAANQAAYDSFPELGRFNDGAINWVIDTSNPVSPENMGASGNGVADDSDALEQCFRVCIFNGARFSSRQSSNYRVNRGIEITSLPAIVHLDFSGCTISVGSFISGARTSPLFFTGSVGSTNISIQNLNLAATDFGRHPNDSGDRTIIGILAFNCKRVDIDNVNMLNFFGSGIRFSNVQGGSIDGCDLINCSGQNTTPGVNFDNYGDGIYITNASKNINVNACNIVTSNDGRGGVVLEFNTDNISVTNTNISGYDRNIHTESGCDYITLSNLTLSNYNHGIILSGTDNHKLSNIYFLGGASNSNAIISNEADIRLFSGPENVVLDNITVVGEATKPTRPWISSSGGTGNISVSNATVSNCMTGARIAGGDGYTFTNSTFSNVGDGNIDTLNRDLIFSNCKMIDSKFIINNLSTLVRDCQFSGDSSLRLISRRGSKVLDCLFMDITGTNGCVGNFWNSSRQSLEISGNTYILSDNTVFTSRIVDLASSSGNHQWHSSSPNVLIDSTSGSQVITVTERAFSP